MLWSVFSLRRISRCPQVRLLSDSGTEDGRRTTNKSAPGSRTHGSVGLPSLSRGLDGRRFRETCSSSTRTCVETATYGVHTVMMCMDLVSPFMQYKLTTSHDPRITGALATIGDPSSPTRLVRR